MIPSALPQVKNVVFLMLENRSLDNVLGWLYQDPTDPAPTPPAHVFPSGSPSLYDGLVPNRYTNPSYIWNGTVKHYPVVPVPGGLGADQDRVPAYDPYEEMKISGAWKGVLNQMFGNQDVITRLPESGQAAAMQGFLQDYYAGYMVGWQGLDILWAYTRSQLPVINGLARNYAVSDRWFCSVPTQTNPNRAYSLCGTSLGRENNLNITAVEQFEVPTVINALARAGKSWGLYYTDVWKQEKSYTEYTFPFLSRAGNSEVAKLPTFFSRARAGTLPDFTYLEPSWGYGKGTLFKQGTDYHPPTHVDPGERFLADVYNAVRTGPQWGETLLIVTFDEHGGTYDHVAPPWGAINPDGMNGVDGFKFNLFGARVPTLLISPFVKPSTVFRAPNGSTYPFDHTSFIKTLLRWAGVDPAQANLGRRMPQAPSFEAVLEREHVNTTTLSAPALRAAAPADELAAPAGAGQPLNALFDGVGFAATKAILAHNDLSRIQAEIRRYRADPQKFEAELGS